MLHEGTGDKLLVLLPLSGLVSGLLTNTLVLGGQEGPFFFRRHYWFISRDWPAGLRNAKQD